MPPNILTKYPDKPMVEALGSVRIKNFMAIVHHYNPEEILKIKIQPEYGYPVLIVRTYLKKSSLLEYYEGFTLDFGIGLDYFIKSTSVEIFMKVSPGRLQHRLYKEPEGWRTPREFALSVRSVLDFSEEGLNDLI